MSFGYVQCHNTLDWIPEVSSTILRDINNAMADTKPIENITSLCAVEMWNNTKNPFWMRVWLEINKDAYEHSIHIVEDFVEVFAL